MKEMEEGIYVCPQCKQLVVVYRGEGLPVPDPKCNDCGVLLNKSQDPLKDLEESPHKMDAIDAVNFCINQLRQYGIATDIKWHLKVNKRLTFFEVVNALFNVAKDKNILEIMDNEKTRESEHEKGC